MNIKIERVLIVGAGTMGKQIALQCASHGHRVLLHDSSPEVLGRAFGQIEELAHGVMAQGFLPGIDLPASLRHIECRTHLGPAAAEADLAIECVPENVAAKQKLFAELGRHCRDDVIYVTNTSSLIPSMFAASCPHPERLAALHFHLPVAISNVVDLMPHPGTDPQVVAALDDFARGLGQIPIHYAREYHGYVFNSIFGAMQRQALDLVIKDVAGFEDVDRSWMGIFKMPIGPFGMFDQIGLDTIAEISHHWAETLNDDAGRKRVAFLRSLTSKGFLGAKSGQGFYRYPAPAYAQPEFLAIR